MIKRIVLLFLVLVSFIATTTYPLTAFVTDIDRAADTVTVGTCTGITYTFKHVEDWEVGDIASLIMFDRLTPYVSDDLILDIRYGGYL